MRPVRDLSPRQATPYLENNGICLEVNHWLQRRILHRYCFA
jgi:hypothetical protein